MRRQLLLMPKIKLTHGGSRTKGNPRAARPLCSKRPIHLVIRSSLATGSKSFLSSRFKTRIIAIVQKQGTKFGVKIYDYANGGNHLHMIVKIHSHTLFKNFLRAVTGLIARLVQSSEKGRAAKAKFWDARPFTRIAEWGKAYDHLKSYLTLNKLEALGFIAHQRRDSKRRKLYSVKCEPVNLDG
jgi:REP element-mobilizing transposase RayT